MSIGPRQFGAFVEELLAELRSLQKQVAAIRNADEATNQTWKEIPSHLSELRVPAGERTKADSYRKKAHRQQVWLTWGTWLAFLAASAYAGIAARQLREIRRTNKLTQQALNASGTALAQTLAKMDLQTQATNRLAGDTETANANVLAADRPWFGVVLAAQDAFEAGKNPSVTVIFLNSGKRPARVLISEVSGNWFTVFPKNPPYSISPNSVKSSDIVVPNGSATTKLSLFQGPLDQATVDTANTGSLKFFLYANIQYVDLRTQKKHFTHSCWVYVGDDPELSRGFYNSGDYNDAN